MLINYYDRNAANFYYIILGKDLLQTCKDQIWLESRIEMDLGPNSPNNKFIECGRES